MSKGRVDVELTANSAQLKREFDTAANKVKSFENRLKKALGPLSDLAAPLSFAALGVGLKSAILDASDLQETISKSKEIFKENSSNVEAWSATLVESFGQSKSEALAAAASYGAVFNVLGVSKKRAVEMSQTLVELASDMASFNNTSVKQAIEAIGAGLRGESEPLRKYAVLLDDATLKAQALKMGIYEGVGALTVQQRSLAAYDVILAQTTTAQGDFSRTSEGTAGQMKIMQAQFKNLSAELGTKLLPIFTQLLQFTNDHHKAISGVVGALIAYKGLKYAGTIALELVQLGKAIAIRYGAKAAMDADTKSTMLNTAAHLANANAQKGSALAGIGGNAGKMIGEKMGKSAAGKFSLAFLAKFSPHVIAASVGFGIGKLAGEKIAEHLDKAFSKRFENANKDANSVLKTMHEMVHAAQTHEQVDKARIALFSEISRLKMATLQSADKEGKLANEHAIAVLQLYDRNLDKLAVQNQQRAVQEMALKKTKEETEAVKNLHDQYRAIFSTRSKPVLKGQKQKEANEQEIKSSAEKETQRNQSFDTGKADFEKKLASEEFLKSLEQENQVLELQAQGFAKKAELLETEISLQKQAAEIASQYGLNVEEVYQKLLKNNRLVEKIKTNSEKSENEKQRKPALVGIQQEIQLLELQAVGESKKAKELEKQFAIRRDTLDIMEQTGLSELEALKLAEKKSRLNEKINELGSSKKIKLRNAEESFDTRMARRSKADLEKIERSKRFFSPTDLGSKIKNEADKATREREPKTILKEENALPAKIDELISIDKKLLNQFEKINQV